MRHQKSILLFSILLVSERYWNSCKHQAITILPLLNVGGMQLFKMEGPQATEKILSRTLEGSDDNNIYLFNIDYCL